MESARVEHPVCALNCNSNGRLEDTALFGACASTLSCQSSLSALMSALELMLRTFKSSNFSAELTPKVPCAAIRVQATCGLYPNEVSFDVSQGLWKGSGAKQRRKPAELTKAM